MIVLKLIALLADQEKSLADIVLIDPSSKVYPPQLRGTARLNQVHYLIELCQQYFAKAFEALEQLILVAQSTDKKGLGNHKGPKLDFRQMQRLVGPIQHICSKLFLLVLSLQATKLSFCAPQTNTDETDQHKCQLRRAKCVHQMMQQIRSCLGNTRLLRSLTNQLNVSG